MGIRSGAIYLILQLHQPFDWPMKISSAPTNDVTLSLNVYYKNTRIKQYHKENRALRTETTINNTYDFAVGKRLHNLPKLRAIGFAANRRLLEVERLSQTPSKPQPSTVI